MAVWVGAWIRSCGLLGVVLRKGRHGDSARALMYRWVSGMYGEQKNLRMMKYAEMNGVIMSSCNVVHG